MADERQKQGGTEGCPFSDQQEIELKPTIRKTLSYTAAVFRLRNHFETRDMIFVQRLGCAIGPVFTVDMKRGKVVDKRVPTVYVLADKYGLVHADEVYPK